MSDDEVNYPLIPLEMEKASANRSSKSPEEAILIRSISFCGNFLAWSRNEEGCYDERKVPGEREVQGTPVNGKHLNERNQLSEKTCNKRFIRGKFYRACDEKKDHDMCGE